MEHDSSSPRFTVSVLTTSVSNSRKNLTVFRLGILPASKKYLTNGGLSPQAGAFTVIGCFLGGVVAIQAISRFLHGHMHSHAVDCELGDDDDACEVRAGSQDGETHVNGHLPQRQEIMSEVTPLLFVDDLCNQKYPHADGSSSPRSEGLHASMPTQVSQSEGSARGTDRGRTCSRNRFPFHSSSETRFGNAERNSGDTSESVDAADDTSHPHHGHAPPNPFLAIGLQTSIAIALHKVPEGFITFATNHANPQLGFSVFMALFIHNITEGFALALPLFLALKSRWKSMLWSSLLGGISQPLGAGVAALWFKLAGSNDMAPGDTVYGCMFAITAGVMTSVGLQLFSESISLAQSKALCVAFVFVGMGILGVSFALTAG